MSQKSTGSGAAQSPGLETLNAATLAQTVAKEPHDIKMRAMSTGDGTKSEEPVSGAEGRGTNIKKLNRCPDGKNSKKQDDEERIHLKKELGLVEGVSMIIGIVIGSGIFVSPKGVISIVDSVGLSLIVWAGSGVITILGALCFAELGTMMPENGGTYNYIHQSFGPLLAFLNIWVTVMVRNNSGLAVVAYTFAYYLVQAVLPGCETVPQLPVKLIALVVLGFLSWVNYVNVVWAAKVQNAFTACKVVAMILIIVVGVTYLAQGRSDNYDHAFEGSDWSVGALSAATYQALFSYSGWENLCYVVEEIKNPDRNLPLSIVISMSLVTIVYTLTNAAYLAVLTPAQMLASNAVAVTFANLTLGVMAWVMPVFVLCSTFGSINGIVFTQARLTYAGAKRDQFPESLGMLSVDKFSPAPAIVLNGLLTMVIVLSSDLLMLINYTTYINNLIALICMAAFFWLRYKEPQRKRPFKVWLVLPVMFTMIQVMLLVLPLLYDPVMVGISIGFMATGLPVYYLTIYRQDLVNKCSGPLSKVTYCIQLLFLSVAEEKVD